MTTTTTTTTTTTATIASALAMAISQLGERSGDNRPMAEPSTQINDQINDQADAQVDARWLLCHVLGKNLSYLMTWPERWLTDPQWQHYQQLIKRRMAGEPVAYLTGVRGFWSFDLKTNNSTLIPRADTECLVERAIALPLDEQAMVLDLGTGTGAIALAIATERPKWRVHACDLNADAVTLARSNVTALALSNVEVRQSAWFTQYNTDFFGGFDLIVGNPPYIDEDDCHLQCGDVRFEPRSALVSAQQGLADILHIVAQARQYLKPHGYLVLEHGYSQGAAVRRIFETHGFTQISTKKDLGNNDRFTEGKNN